MRVYIVKLVGVPNKLAMYNCKSLLFLILSKTAKKVKRTQNFKKSMNAYFL